MSPAMNGVAKQNGHGQSWKAAPGDQKAAAMKQAESIYQNEASKSRYEAYSRLQASAVAFGEKLPIPEIVAVGGQSDGKSSLLEALLGFRFNIREVEMGTRRPLMLQMIHDPDALEPRCRLQVSGTRSILHCHKIYRSHLHLSIQACHSPYDVTGTLSVKFDAIEVKAFHHRLLSGESRKQDLDPTSEASIIEDCTEAQNR